VFLTIAVAMIATTLPNLWSATSGTPATAQFIKADTSTQGNWQGVYGADGANVINSSVNYPSYAAVTPQGQQSWFWAASTSDPRALQTTSVPTKRIAAAWYSSSSFSIDLNLTDGNSHQVALYCLDWEGAGRAERIDILDAASGTLLDSRNVVAFSQTPQYLVWSLKGHVTIDVTQIAGVNAVVSGIFFGGPTPVSNPPTSGPVTGASPTSTAQFVKTDTSTLGNWQTSYGADGSNIIDNSVNYPSYAAVTPQGQQSWIWAASSSDPRALQKPSAPSDRIAAAWYSSSSFSIDLNLTDGNSHQMALYFLDWSGSGRVERVDILDAASRTLLDSRNVVAFSQTPQYLVWSLKGHVTIEVTQIAGVNAVVSGVFFGGPASVSNPPTSGPVVGTSLTSVAQFVKTDTTTQGNWQSLYGADGSNVIDNSVDYPSYAAVTPQGEQTWIWAASTSDPRALQKPSAPSDRVAAGWYSNSSFNIDVNLTDGNSHQVALYCLDWTGGRVERINILDAASGTLLDTRNVTSFSQTPQYLVWNLKGHVTINVTQIAGVNAVVSGIFFGGPASVSNPPTAGPVVISVSPTSGSFTAGQSTQFNASVSGGSGNTAVTWSIVPPVGTVVNGVYTAPASIASLQSVTLMATSVADSTKIAVAVITLTPVILSLSPGSASLSGGQSATFTPTVNATSNTAVTWSINPPVGTITNGVYQAPAIIAAQQTVTVTATSAADSTKTAMATVSLQPVGVTVSPAAISLGAGASATFSAALTGTGNPAVTWSLSPAVGIVVNGVYTAPATIASPQTVIVTATSVADPTKTGTATVSLTSTSTGPASPATTVTLPVEVIGPVGTTATTSVTIPTGSNLSGPLSLWMQIHGLRFETQASVQVNSSGWMPISDSTVTLLGNATAYGGIGGGFSTLKMTLNLPAGSIQAGTNTISFRFNQTDGRSSGFRVLAFNVEAADGSLLIPASTFVYDDPNTWQPPSSTSSDIAAGQTLWSQAALTTPLTTGGTKPILAHCSDCHTTDGRDLKYFNYSNNSIQTRSLFHGLTAQQGDQIASYIRSLNVVNPGRPWNPPYQPGPGLDSQPLLNWAAGAGLDAVLDTDAEMVNAMFPAGFQGSVFAATSRLSQRETPIQVQLPDWNQWLPGTHPMDAFGSTFTGSGYNTIFQTFSSNLQVLNPAAYVAQEGNFGSWFSAFYTLYNQVGTPIWAIPGGGWTPATTDAMYSLPQWGMVKTWELMNEYQLEGFSQQVFGPSADARGWSSSLPFFVSPHELKMNSNGTPGLRNGSQADYMYLSFIWYHLQLILNNSNQQDHFPIDYGYMNGFIQELGSLSSPQAGIETLWMIKGLQALQETGTGPQLGQEGWQPSVSQISYLVTTEWNTNVWTGVDPITRAALTTGIVQSWLSQASQFTPQQFYAGGWTTPSATPVPDGNAYDSVFVDWVWYMIPRFEFVGVSPAVAGQLAQWAQTLWPSVNWTADLNATCGWLNNVPNGAITCSQ